MPVHRSAIANYCTAFLDSNILLHFAFDEHEFQEKIRFFEKSANQYGVPIEILPQVNYEVTKRLMVATSRFVKILNDVRQAIEDATKNKIDTVPADKAAVRLIEQAVDGTVGFLRKLITKEKEFDRSVRQVRSVEAALIQGLYEVLESGKSVSLGAMIRDKEKEFAKSYVDYSDRLSTFLTGINARYVNLAEIPSARPLLPDLLMRKCGVTNKHDVKILCEAICRMFHQNRWCALVALDYSDLVHNKTEIEAQTLLVVCDPMYVFSALDARLELTFSARQEAGRRRLQYADLVNFPRPVGVV